MPYVKATIESVLGQNYSKLEHIVMDGNSSDGSVDLYKKYPHLHWTSEKDRGQSHAINKGFAKSSGEIIGWLNADDTYTPGTFKKVIEYFDKHPETDLIGTDINIIDENDNVVGMTPGGPLDKVELLTVNRIKQPTVFMRRRVIEILKGVDESLHFVMDQEFWLRVALNGFKYEYIPNERFANFRLIQGTKTFEMGTKFREEWHKVISKVIEDPAFSDLSVKEKQEILSESLSDLHIQKMMAAAGNRRFVFQEALKVLKANSKLYSNLGFYKIFLQQLFGSNSDRLGKFKKNESKYS